VAAKVGAGPHERTPERTGYRNGHRGRRWDTRLGTISLQAPTSCGKAATCRASSSTVSGAQSLISVIQEAVPQGRFDEKDRDGAGGIRHCLSIGGAGEPVMLDAGRKGGKFRERPFGEFRYVRVDAMSEIREDEQVESMAVVIATGVNPRSPREVLGLDLIPTESEESCGRRYSRN
jgi:putative transposase